MHIGRRRFMARAVALLGALMLLAGCTTVGPAYRPPEMDAPESYLRGGDPDADRVELKWWELFDDPVLQRIVALALGQNRDLMVAASRILQARAALGFTRADEYPRVDVDAGASTGNFAGGTRSDANNATVYFAPVFNWEIDFWGKFRRATEAAQADLLASEYGLRTVQLVLISDVAGTYYQLLDYHQRLDVTYDTLASRQKSLEIIEQRFQAGLIPEVDLNQAQIQKEIAAAAIPEYQRLIARTEHLLSILLGRLPGEIKTGAALGEQSIPPAIPAGLPSELLQRRPDIAAGLHRLEAAYARIGVAEALRFPSIGLTGALGVASTDLGAITSGGGVWSVGGGLLAPLIDFDKNRQRVEIEKEKTRQVRFEVENLMLTAFREVEDALVGVRTYRAQSRAVERKRAAARNANELAKERYDRGVTSYLEVLDTERTLFSVQLELSELTQRYLDSYVNLYKALGGGWITREEMAQEMEGRPPEAAAGTSGGG